jgi:hypothetical protein
VIFAASAMVEVVLAIWTNFSASTKVVDYIVDSGLAPKP